MRSWLGALLLLGCGACGQDSGTRALAVRGPEPLRTGEAQRARLCGRGNDDPVIDVFCGSEPPEIEGVVALRTALGLGAEVGLVDRGFAISGHSSSLVRSSVSAINPRIVFARFTPGTLDVTAVAFARGEPFTEIVVRDRISGQLQFYLAVFTLPCEQEPEGCSFGDLLTEAADAGWKALDVYGEEDLDNTPRDCRVCHQPEGPGTTKVLRMQERQAPWNHWFFPITGGGDALLSDYFAAKGDEPFAGVPGADIVGSQPGLLSFTVFATSTPQMHEFDSRSIEAEVVAHAAEHGVGQPGDNSVPGRSQTWEQLYARANRGEVIPVPYHDVKVTDPDKLANMTEAYTAYRAGELEADDLPDIREVFREEAEERAHMGLVTEPGMTGGQVLMQACAVCHNGRLDQSLSRARFDVDLDKLDEQAKQRAIARIQLPRDDPRAMPPALFRRLSEEGKERLIELLSP